MISEIKGKVVPVKLWAPLEEVESQALDQLLRQTRLGIGARLGLARLFFLEFGRLDGGPEPGEVRGQDGSGDDRPLTHSRILPSGTTIDKPSRETTERAAAPSA